MSPTLPKVLSTSQVARMLHTEADPWDARRARKRLMATGALTKLGGRWVTTPSMLIEATGAVGVELLTCFESREL